MLIYGNLIRIYTGNVFDYISVNAMLLAKAIVTSIHSKKRKNIYDCVSNYLDNISIIA